MHGNMNMHGRGPLVQPFARGISGAEQLIKFCEKHYSPPEYMQNIVNIQMQKLLDN